MRLQLALRHLGAVLAGTLLLVASSQALPTPSSGPTMGDFISEVATSQRPVMLFGPISNDRFMVIIGTGLDPLIGAQLFNQPLDTLGSDCVRLKPPTPLGSRWPGVTRFYLHLFALPDSTGDNIILVPASDASSVDVLNLDSGTVKMLSKLSGQGRHRLQDNTPLSSTEQVSFLAINGTDGSHFVWRNFDGEKTLTQAVDVTDIKESYICSLGKTSSGERIIVNQTTCQVPIKWNIRTGYVNGTSVVLVDEQNAVYIFDRRVFTSGKPADVVKIPAEKFWTEWQPPSNSSKPGWFRGLTHRPDFLIYTVTGIIIAAFITYSSIKLEVSSCCRRRQPVDGESAGEPQQEHQVDAPQEVLPYPKSLRQYLQYKRLVRSGKIKRRSHYLKGSDNFQNWDYPRNGPKSGEVVPGSRSRSFQAKMMDRSAKKRRASISASRGNRRAAVVPFGVIPRSKKEFSMAKTASRTIKKAPAKVSLKAKIRKSKTRQPPKTSYKTAKSSQSSSLYTKAKRID